MKKLTRVAKSYLTASAGIQAIAYAHINDITQKQRHCIANVRGQWPGIWMKLNGIFALNTIEFAQVPEHYPNIPNMMTSFLGDISMCQVGI